MLIDYLSYDEAVTYIEKRRLPDEEAVAVHADGREEDITRLLRRPRLPRRA